MYEHGDIRGRVSRPTPFEMLHHIPLRTQISSSPRLWAPKDHGQKRRPLPSPWFLFIYRPRKFLGWTRRFSVSRFLRLSLSPFKCSTRSQEETLFRINFSWRSHQMQSSLFHRMTKGTKKTPIHEEIRSVLLHKARDRSRSLPDPLR